MGTPVRIGPFAIERELGRGSNGVVYLARRDGVPEPCALKVFLDPADAEGRARFDLEGAVAGRLAHPGIVGAFESGQHQGRPWIAMELADGETLAARLARGPLAPEDAQRLGDELCEALAYAHAQGVIHRDLKPANVVLDQRTGRARIMDFGLARSELSSLTRTGDAMGTPYYMAPEQLDDAKRADERADVYALGAILYECLSGVRPHEGRSIADVVQAKRAGLATPLGELVPGLPAWLERVVERAMAPQPRDRFASAEELGRALRRGDGRPVEQRDGRGTVGIVLVFLILALLGATLTARHWRAAAHLAQAKARLRTGELALERGDLETARVALQQVSGEPALAKRVEEQLLRLAEAEALAKRRRALEAVCRDAHAATAESDPAELGRLAAALRDADPGLVPQLDQAQDGLARTLVAAALQRSRDVAPYQEPLDLLGLAERLSRGRAAGDAARLERASYLFRRGRFQEASEVAADLVERPGRLGYQARYVAAFGQLWQDRYAQGLDALHAIYQDNPQGVVGLNAGAVWNSYNGHNDVGEQLARQSLKQDPAYADAWISLTFCRNDQFRTLGQAKLAEALEANDRALSLAPDHPRAWMARAFVLSNMGRDAEGLAAYDRVIQLTEPRPFGRALRHRGLRALQQGDLRAAFADLDRAVARNAQDTEARVYRGLIYAKQQDPQRALEDWRQAARDDPRGFEGCLRRLDARVAATIRQLLEQGR